MDFIQNLSNYTKNIIIAITALVVILLIFIVIYLIITNRSYSRRLFNLEDHHFRNSKNTEKIYNAFTIAKFVAATVESVIISCDFDIVRGLNVSLENGFVTLSVMCGHKIPTGTTRHYHVFSITYEEVSKIIDSAIYCGGVVVNGCERFYFIQPCGPDFKIKED